MKKLNLSRETLRLLTPQTSRMVVGGTLDDSNTSDSLGVKSQNSGKQGCPPYTCLRKCLLAE